MGLGGGWMGGYSFFHSILGEYEGLVAMQPGARAPPAKGSWDAGFPPHTTPPWEKGDGARMQGNAGTNKH